MVSPSWRPFFLRAVLPPVNAVHPGVIVTHLQRHLGAGVRAAFSVIEPLLLKSVAQGAATQCYVAVHPAAASICGEYFADCNIAETSAKAHNTALANQLWEKTEQIIARLPQMLAPLPVAPRKIYEKRV